VSHQRGTHPRCGSFRPAAPIARDTIAGHREPADLEPRRRADRARYERADTIRLRGDGLGLRIAAANPT